MGIRREVRAGPITSMGSLRHSFRAVLCHTPACVSKVLAAPARPAKISSRCAAAARARSRSALWPWSLARKENTGDRKHAGESPAISAEPTALFTGRSSLPSGRTLAWLGRCGPKTCPAAATISGIRHSGHGMPPGQRTSASAGVSTSAR